MSCQCEYEELTRLINELDEIGGKDPWEPKYGAKDRGIWLRVLDSNLCQLRAFVALNRRLDAMEGDNKDLLVALRRMEAILWIRERAKIRRPIFRLRGWVYGVIAALVGYTCYKCGF
mgnify:FL=1